MSFDAFMSSGKKKSVADMVDAAKQASKGSQFSADERKWRLTTDKAKNGFAIIRFLPAKDPEKDDPWVRYWDHGFKGPTGRWYIEKSRTTLSEDDPVSEANSILWNTGLEEDKNLARERKRRLHHVSNIYVIKDPAKPECEGKVFLFEYGKKIFDKLIDAMDPSDADVDPDVKAVNPFDLLAGANFKLKCRDVDDYNNYDRSEFEKPSKLLGGDPEKLKAVYESMYDLGEFTDPSNYKSYDELKKKFLSVIGEPAKSEPIRDPETRSAPVYSSDGGSSGLKPLNETDGLDPDTEDYFNSLAQQA